MVLAAEARLGRPLDDALVFAATHTHAGPGRLLDGGGLFDLIADSFFPEFYERMVDAAATAGMTIQAVRPPEEALCDPLFLADGCVVEIDDPELGRVRQVEAGAVLAHLRSILLRR